MFKGLIVFWVVVVALIFVLTINHFVSQQNKCEARGGTYVSRSDICIKSDGVIRI